MLLPGDMMERYCYNVTEPVESIVIECWNYTSLLVFGIKFCHSFSFASQENVVCGLYLALPGQVGTVRDP